MHSFALNLGLVLAAEKSKTPFYIAGGVLVAWALIISMGIGMRRENFPENLGQQRAIMAVSAVLVVIAVSMAIVTSGGGKSSEASASQTTTAAPSAAAPAETTSAPATATATTPTATTPIATTGTPAPPSSPAAASAVTITANAGGQLSYDTTKATAKAGKVTISMTNMSPVEHNVTVAQGSKVLGSTPTFAGGTKGFSVTLAPGTYTFYCSVPGHRQAGMEGVLTVSK